MQSRDFTIDYDFVNGNEVHFYTNNPNNLTPDYPRYGQRNILICKLTKWKVIILAEFEKYTREISKKEPFQPSFLKTLPSQIHTSDLAR